jgi:hypothetical protein
MPRCMHADVHHGDENHSLGGRKNISEKLCGLAEQLAMQYGNEIANNPSSWNAERRIHFEEDMTQLLPPRSEADALSVLKDEEQRYLPLGEEGKRLSLRPGQQVAYTLSNGSATPATIIAAHAGDAFDPEPFYTIAFADGSERETTR